MGKLILRNNGIETQLINGVGFSTLTPQTNTYYIGIDPTNGAFQKFNPSGVTIDYDTNTGGSIFTGGTVNGQTTFTNGLFANVISASTYLNLPSTGGGIIEVTYSELVSGISGSTLTPGTFYLITDYRTCYDQPDFDYDGNPIINTGVTGNYKQGPVEPILVLATSNNTISVDAHQPEYPNDKIKYDWSFSTTESTNGTAFGRITERIDEFNNRTDYDHRNILFKRYKLFTHREELRINGTVEILSDGTVIGTNTTFNFLTVGDVIYTDNTYPSYFEIISISGNTTMVVSGDTINAVGPGSVIYKTIEETNDSNGYFSYKRTNVKTSDYLEYTTFGDALSNNYAKNNYIGNHTNNYQNEGNGFLLPNNVFLEGQYESNKLGDYCYNNTWGTDNENNTWGDFCYNNVSTNDIDRCTFGNYFRDNLINVNLNRNQIGNDFTNNKLLAENNEDFRENIIADGFNNNIIYSEFYDNTINVGFENNVIGDYGNLTNFRFYRNQIGNYFSNNTIRQDFQNNNIRTNFQSNTINGDFVGNTILNGFNNNITGNYFGVNEIGNAFNNNTIYDDFYYNKTNYWFNSNIISNDFIYNNIETYFSNNRPLNYTLFGWSDLSTVSTRTYNTFLNSLDGGGIGDRILGKEFVMRVISTLQYFKFKFYQWTQDGNGGGIQYERTELDSSGNQIGSTIIFTKTNYGNEVDIVVPGVVEITRGDNQGIYNIITEGSWSSGSSPGDTEWNSIYTVENNGKNFGYNKIGNNFYNNLISNDFGYGGGNAEGNIINDNFQTNNVGEYFYNNKIGNYFRNNVLGNYFQNNSIKNHFLGNTIGNHFEGNEIGNYFGNQGGLVQNTIFNNFRNNKIGNYFGNEFNYPTITGGTGNDGGNIINDNFQFNEIGDNFIFNATDSEFQYNKMGTDTWFNVFGQNFEHNSVGDLFVGNGGSGGFPTPMGNSIISNKIGNYSAFNFIGNNFQYNKIGDFFGNAGVGTENDIADGFNNNNIGNYFGDDGSHTDGGNVINDGFYDNLIGNKFYSNTIDSEFYRNDIGNEFFSNTLNNSGGAQFHNNEIGNRFRGNTTDGYFYGNVIGGGFNNNNVGDGFYSNEIGFGFNANTVGTSFGANTIYYYFSNNTIDNNFYSNIVKSSFSNNTIVNDFRYNNVTSDVSGTDFSGATIVYDDYDKTFFRRQDGTVKLSYYDSSDVLTIANITD
jgi:hypothetical protein